MDDVSGAVGKGVQPPDGTTVPPLPQCAYLVDVQGKRHGMHPAYRSLQNVMKYGGESTFEMTFTAGQMYAYARAFKGAEPSMSTTSPSADSGTGAYEYFCYHLAVLEEALLVHKSRNAPAVNVARDAVRDQFILAAEGGAKP